MSKSFSFFIEENRYIDPWRLSNPSSKVFSYFSHVHGTFSQIDYFFIDRAFLSSVKSVEYFSIVISDHAPLQLDILLYLESEIPATMAAESLVTLR